MRCIGKALVWREFERPARFKDKLECSAHDDDDDVHMMHIETETRIGMQFCSMLSARQVKEQESLQLDIRTCKNLSMT